jgi:hypothetical protein
MNITVKCNVSLSKKIRALSKNNTKCTLVTGTLENGVGEGELSISVDDDANMGDIFNKETSIMIVPISYTEGAFLSVNTEETKPVSNLFMNGANIEDDENPVIKKIGATRPPENKRQNSTSVKSKTQIQKETPVQFKETQIPEAKKYITNMTQLLEAIHLAENKKSDVDITKIQNPRLKAVAMEEKEKAEAIDYPAFVVNHSRAALTINDLGISLSLNIPYNLNNVSAKRLANSKELLSLFRANLIKFVSPDEVQAYRNKVVEQESYGLDVYDNRDQAKAAIGEMSESKTHMVKISEENDLSLKDLEGDTEEEKILKSLPPRKQVEEQDEDGNIVVTSHRYNDGSRLRQQRDITADSVENSKGAKSIRRSGIQFN